MAPQHPLTILVTGHDAEELEIKKDIVKDIYTKYGLYIMDQSTFGGVEMDPAESIRILKQSLGVENNARHVDALIQTLEEIASAPRTCIDRFVASIHNGTPSLPHTEAENRIRDFVSARAERVFAFSS